MDRTVALAWRGGNRLGVFLSLTLLTFLSQEVEPGDGEGAPLFHWRRALLWEGADLPDRLWQAAGGGHLVTRTDNATGR